MDVYGLIVLFVVLIVASVFQVAVLFGAMFALHKYAADKFPETTYGSFDFDQIRKPELSDFLVRLAAILFVPTIVLHLLEFLSVGIYIRAYPALITVSLLILETAAIAAGFLFILHLDRRRTIVLTSVCALFYLFLYWILIFRYLAY